MRRCARRARIDSPAAKEGGELLKMERSFPNHLPDDYGGIEETTPCTSARPSSVQTSPPPARWPVLARVPEVHPLQRLAQRRAKPDDSACRSTDYRFDLPEVRPPEPLSAEAARDTRDYAVASMAPNGSPPAPHLRRRLANESTMHESRNSRILPDSNPFLIPSASLHDQVAPLVRFLVMVALFTLAGTSVLMMYNDRGEATSEPSASGVATREPELPTAPAPIAASPTLTPAPITISLDPGLSPDKDPRNDLTAGAPNAGEADAAPSAAAEAKLPYPTTDYPPAAITDAATTVLPRVQNSDAAPAVARFTGQLEAVSPRTAQHDDEPSLH